jgi:putative acetyltransferase
MNMTIRPCKVSDITALADIYKQGIRRIGSSHYSGEQIAAWSGFAEDIEEFGKWISNSMTFVAVGPEKILLGFTGIERNGRISSLFVAPEVMRKGIGSALLRYLMEEIRLIGHNIVTTDASEYSKPLFEKFGFKVIKIEQTQFKGVKFQRYQMVLHI